MSKKNKWIVIPFMVVVLLVLGTVYILPRLKSAAPAEPLKAVPVDASLIIKINDIHAVFKKISAGNAIWNELKVIPYFGRIDKQLRFLDSLYRNVPEIREVMQTSPSFISAHVSGKDRISFMHVLHLNARINERKIVEIISGLIIKSGTMSTRKYEGTNIYEVSFLHETAAGNFSFAVSHDILMISSSTILLENSIRQIVSDETVDLSEGFSEIYAIAGKNVDANLFVNFQQFMKALSVGFKPDFKAEVRSVRNFAGWAEMDINLLTEMLLMNGFVNAPDSVESVASLFLGQSPQRITVDEMLPGNIASFLTVTMSDIDKYFSHYQQFLKDQEFLNNYRNMLQSVNNTYHINLPGDLTEIMDNELTLAFDQGDTKGQPVRTYILMRIKSRAQAEEKLQDIIRKIAIAESRSVDSYSTTYKLDNELKYKISYIPVHQFIAKIFGDLFSLPDKHYFVILDNYLIFSSSVESLKLLIHDQVLNKTMQNDLAYKEFKNSLSPRSNLFFYCNLRKSIDAFSPYLIDAVSKTWDEYLPAFNGIQTSGFQLYSNNNMLYSNFLIRNINAGISKPQTVWESKIDTLADFKPVFVVNHQTNQNEVFVQDLKNNIYLINQVGRILWKLQLPEPIKSEVFQVDYFSNGKLQLLFSTRNFIYLVDRNGNFVEKYPVKLRSPATCGVSVFDYDNNRNYRLFIACEDRSVYAYTKEGNLLSGWNFSKSENFVTQPVSHFRIGDKDYIVFGDGYKTYILDRKGNTRVRVDTYFPMSARNNYYLDLPRNTSEAALVTTDTTGKVYFLGFDGKVKMMETKDKFTNNHYFDYKDLNGDGKSEFIFLEGKKLTVYNSNMSRLFACDFKSSVQSRPAYYQFSFSDRKLGVVSRQDNLIYLINNTGEFYNGFPLQGNTPFSIGNFGDSLSRFSLVVGSNDNFLYNYRVK
jgi:hypothetical protein